MLSFVKAIMNFVTIIQYYFYIFITLLYLKHYLKFINKIKKNVKFFRINDLFNFSKMHMFIYYNYYIEQFDCLM